MSQPPLSLRQATPEDLKFVFDSWARSYRDGGCAPQIGYDLFRPGHEALMKRLVDRDFVTVAYATEIPDEICGWVCAGLDAIHYVYVKQAYRRRGIGIQLCALYKVNHHSFETRTGRKFATKLRTRFNPYLAITP